MNEVGIATYEPGPSSLLALLEGTLAERDGCLGLAVAHQGREHWSHLAVPVDAAHPALGVLVRAGGRDYRIGDEICFGGGFVEASHLSGLVRPSGCRHDDGYALMNPDR